MDYDENTLNSAPTMGPGGTGRSSGDFDEPSLGSAPTMGPGRDVSTKCPPSALGQIDQYLLVQKLGGGGFGVVYLAHDTVSGVDVALKTLHPLLKSNPEEMEELRAKFALVSRLSHPNIASPLVLHPCRDIVITDDEARRELRLSPGDSVMVMRYAPGVTLSKWRKQFPKGVVPFDIALEVVRQIAFALDYAHGEKIVHRDIKPANVMVETLPAEASLPSQVQSSEFKVQSSGGASRPGEPSLVTRHPSLVTSRIRVRILDFGLAAEIRSSMSRVSTETGDTSGTRPYMAPEQWLGKKQDGRTDQYALACVLYELLSGAPPFSGVFETGDPAIMLATVKNETPEEIEGLPTYVNAALARSLAKDPKERFANCTEFVAALEKDKSPYLDIIASVNGKEVKGALLTIWGQQIKLPARIQVETGWNIDSCSVQLDLPGRGKYRGQTEPMTVDWQGTKSLIVPLSATAVSGVTGKKTGKDASSAIVQKLVSDSGGRVRHSGRWWFVCVAMLAVAGGVWWWKSNPFATPPQQQQLPPDRPEEEVSVVPQNVATEEMISTTYKVLPFFWEFFADPGQTGDSQDGSTETDKSTESSSGEYGSIPDIDWKKVFTDYGVEWPVGADIAYYPGINEISVYNTFENQVAVSNAIQRICTKGTEFRAAEVRECLSKARAARAREDWSACLASAERVLKWDPDNNAASELQLLAKNAMKEAEAAKAKAAKEAEAAKAKAAEEAELNQAIPAIPDFASPAFSLDQSEEEPLPETTEPATISVETSFPKFKNGLVLWYDFGDTGSLNENKTRVFDKSGGGNNGEVVGATWRTANNGNGFFYFDGLPGRAPDTTPDENHDFIRISDSALGFPLQDFTISVVCNPQNKGAIIGSGQSELWNREWFLNCESFVWFWKPGYRSGGVGKEGHTLSFPSCQNVCSHIVVKRTGGTVSLYRDGGLKGKTTGFGNRPLPIYSYGLFIGNEERDEYTTWRQWFCMKGEIYQVLIWKRALTDNEISTLSSNVRTCMRVQANERVKKRNIAASRKTVNGQDNAGRQVKKEIEPLFKALCKVKTTPSVENVTNMEKIWLALSESDRTKTQEAVMEASCAFRLQHGEKDAFALRKKYVNNDDFWSSVTEECQSCYGSKYVDKACSVCKGSGVCPTCHGRGRFGGGYFRGAASTNPSVSCSRCKGSGHCSSCQSGRMRVKCTRCSGAGRLLSNSSCQDVFEQNIDQAIDLCYSMSP